MSCVLFVPITKLSCCTRPEIWITQCESNSLTIVCSPCSQQAWYCIHTFIIVVVHRLQWQLQSSAPVTAKKRVKYKSLTRQGRRNRVLFPAQFLIAIQPFKYSVWFSPSGKVKCVGLSDYFSHLYFSQWSRISFRAIRVNLFLFSFPIVLHQRNLTETKKNGIKIGSQNFPKSFFLGSRETIDE